MSRNIPLILLISEFKKQPIKYFRTIFLLSLIISIVLTISLIPESYEFMRVTPHNTAQYDIHISGDLQPNIMNNLIESCEVKAMTSVSRWGGLNVSNDKNSKTDITRVLFVDDMNTASYMLPYNKNLLKEGTFDKDSVVITENQAKMLGVGIGDTLKISWEGFDLPDHYITMPISGIYYDTADGVVIIADIITAYPVITEVVSQFNDSSQPIITIDAEIFTSHYIQLQNQDEQNLHNFISSLGDSNIIVDTRVEAINIERNAIEQMTGGTFKYIKIGSILLYFLLLIYFLIHKFSQRATLYAILRTCGIPNNIAYKHFILELFITIIIISSVSIYLCYVYFSFYLRAIILPSLMIKTLTFLLLGTICIIILFCLYRFEMIKQKSLYDVLREEY